MICVISSLSRLATCTLQSLSKILLNFFSEYFKHFQNYVNCEPYLACLRPSPLVSTGTARWMSLPNHYYKGQ